MVFTAIQNVARVVLTLNGDANGTMSNHIIYMSKSALELHSDLDSASQFVDFVSCLLNLTTHPTM